MDIRETIDQIARELSSTPIEGAASEPILPDVTMGSPTTPDAGKDIQLTPQIRALRASIIAIQSDPQLSATDKAHKIQALMMQQFKTAGSALNPTLATSQSTQTLSGQPSSSEDTVLKTRVKHIDGTEIEVTATAADKSYHDESQVLGCQHYSRASKMQATCCQEFHTCRFCHDSECTHQMNRFDVKQMMCMYCQTVQPAAQDCAECGACLGKYYCDICHLWDNSPEKNIFHCDKCQLCRVGKGLGIDYFHCDKCGVCLAMSLKDNHRCIERNLESDCPICGEYMFTSTHMVMFMPCGHSIHWKCYQEHINNSYQCPICWKSLANMTSYFQQIDRMLEEHRMPAEYEHFWSVVFCNDCEKKSRSKYHFLYHKCQECNSYNTKVVHTIQERVVATVSGSGAVELEMVSELTENGSIRPRSSSNMSSSSSFVPDDNESRNR